MALPACTRRVYKRGLVISSALATPARPEEAHAVAAMAPRIGVGGQPEGGLGVPLGRLVPEVVGDRQCPTAHPSSMA